MSEMRDVVDEDDNVIGMKSSAEVSKKNMLRRGVSVFVFNDKGEIFVHKRTPQKFNYPNTYDLAIRGGVKAGETYEEAAKRELEEEIGINNMELKFLFKAKYKNEKQNAFVYSYRIIHDGPFTLKKDELQDGKFMSLNELKKLMEKEEFCKPALGFFEEYERFT